MTVAESLRRYRKEFNKTQKDLADVLGISHQAYQVYEVKVKPPAEVIVKLATKLNISADYLLGLTDTPRPLKGTDFDTELVNLAVSYNDALQKVLAKRKEAMINSAEG